MNAPTKYTVSRSGFVQLAEPIKRYFIKNGGLGEIQAAMVAGNLVMEIQPVIEDMVEQAISREALPTKSKEASE